MSNYTVYNGVFKCQVCNLAVTSLRLYTEDKKLTWMCRDKHLSSVNLKTKKSKKDYERTI